MVPRSHVSFYSFLHHIVKERAQRKLKDSLREHIDLEGQLHNSKEQLSIINSSTLPYN